MPFRSSPPTQAAHVVQGARGPVTPLWRGGVPGLQHGTWDWIGASGSLSLALDNVSTTGLEQALRHGPRSVQDGAVSQLERSDTHPGNNLVVTRAIYNYATPIDPPMLPPNRLACGMMVNETYMFYNIAVGVVAAFRAVRLANVCLLARQGLQDRASLEWNVEIII